MRLGEISATIFSICGWRRVTSGAAEVEAAGAEGAIAAAPLANSAAMRPAVMRI
jgi:hypothetical protein